MIENCKCKICKQPIPPSSSNNGITKKYCSNQCRQKDYRKRKKSREQQSRDKPGVSTYLKRVAAEGKMISAHNIKKLKELIIHKENAKLRKRKQRAKEKGNPVLDYIP